MEGQLITLETNDRYIDLTIEDTILIIAKTYENPIALVLSTKVAPIENGTIYFDLLLCNGYADNRFIKCEIKDYTYVRDSLKVIKEVPIAIINKSQEYLNNNLDLITRSVIIN